MGKYILGRLIQAIPLMVLIAFMTWFMLQLAGDPLQYLTEDPRVSEEERFRLRALLGLNDPWWIRFSTWLFGDDGSNFINGNCCLRDISGDGVGDVFGENQGILRGDFGESVRVRNKTALELVISKLPNTLILGVAVLTVAIAIALFVGIFSALRQYSRADNFITGISFVLVSMPSYLLAFIMIYIFAVQLRLLHDSGDQWSWVPYLPVQGMRPTRGATGSLIELVWHMILPVSALALVSVAGYSRFIRSSMLEVLSSDYVRTAQSKGLANRRVVFLHAFKNAALPLITLIGLDLPFLLGGFVITEQIFSWDGMGLLFIKSLEPIDPPVIMVFTLMIALAVVVCQLITDVLYAFVDPRVRFN